MEIVSSSLLVHRRVNHTKLCKRYKMLKSVFDCRTDYWYKLLMNTLDIYKMKQKKFVIHVHILTIENFIFVGACKKQWISQQNRRIKNNMYSVTVDDRKFTRTNSRGYVRIHSIVMSFLTKTISRQGNVWIRWKSSKIVYWSWHGQYRLLRREWIHGIYAANIFWHDGSWSTNHLYESTNFCLCTTNQWNSFHFI